MTTPPEGQPPTGPDGAPPPGGPDGTPPTGPYGAPNADPYGAPPAGPYGAPPAGPYGAPPPGPYGAPPAGPYGAPPTGPYGAPAQQASYGPPAGYGVQPATGPTTDVVSVLGLVLAFLLAPVGLVLSIVGIVRTAGGKRKGRGLAVAGVIVSVLVTAASVAAIVALASFVAEETGAAVDQLEEAFPTADPFTMEPFPTLVPVPTLEPVPPMEPVPTGEATGGAEPEDGVALPQGVPLGEAADLDGLRLTVTGVDLEADAAVAAESPANPPPTGRYVIVSGTVENTSAEARSIYFGLNVGYVSAVGSVYDEGTCDAVVAGAAADLPDLEPGGSTQVRWCLDVPVEEVGDGSVLVFASGSDASAVWADR